MKICYLIISKKDIITSNFDKQDLYNNKDIVIKEPYTKFIITTYKNNKIITLEENCINIIRSTYNILNIDKLVILIIDIKKENMANNKIVYEIYYDLYNNNTLSKLNLILCNNEMAKCSNYTIESLLQDLCITCIESYHPKYNDNNNKNFFIKCYEKPEGYFLDKDNYYKNCYLSCDTCTQQGNNENHNCDSCKKEFPYELDYINTKNCYEKCVYNTYYDLNSNKNYCTYNSSCPNDYNKKITKKNICIDECFKDKEFPYEFRSTCYNECPLNISIKSETKDFFCNVICPKEFPFEIISTQKCADICSIKDRQKGLCKNNYQPKDEETVDNDNNNINKKIEDKAVENIQEEITRGFDTNELDKGENIIIKQKDSTVTISTTENQKNEKSKNISTVNLGECENKIKDEYNIPRNKSLYILKLDIYQEGYEIPKIEYEVYYPLFNNYLIKLNMTVCENIKINVSIPVTISENNIDKANASSDYYNDICYTDTSENGTDISLTDRKKNFVNNNLTVCEEDCDFISYDYEMKKAVCSCKVKTNSSMKISGNSIDIDKLLNSFTNFKNIANVKILKCYRLIFGIEAYKNNYGNLILLGIMLLLFITMIIFYCKGWNYLKELMDKILFLKSNSKKVKAIKNKKEKELNRQRINENINNININNEITNGNVSSKKKKIKRKKGKKSIIKKNDGDIRTINNNINNIIQIAHPLNVLYKGYLDQNNFKEDDINFNKPNPIKKNKKKNNNKIINLNKIPNRNNLNDDNTISNKNNINNLNRPLENMDNNLTLNLNGTKINLTEDEIYEMILSLNKLTQTELNNLQYKQALKKDKRSYCVYYFSLIKTKHLLFFSFLPLLDFNSRIIKIFLFFFNFGVAFTVNALFFSDKTMHKIYEDGGDFNFIYNIPQILYSSLISGSINAMIKMLASSESNFIEFKKIKSEKEKELRKKADEILNKLKIKFLSLFIIILMLLVLFWLYLACFCAVYKNTQIHLIKDTIISFGTSMIYPIGIYLFPGIFRIIALKGKDREFMFNFSKLLQMI